MFEPSPPQEHDEVIKLYAIAARAACARPNTLANISAALQTCTQDLQRPESITAQECQKLWLAFVRTTQTLPEAKWMLAGKALVGDLEAIGLRLDLMPLSAWDRLPNSLAPASAPKKRVPAERSMVAQVVSGEGKSVARFIQQAQQELSGPHSTPWDLAVHVHTMLLGLDSKTRAALLTSFVEDQEMSKGEAIMLTRLFARALPLSPEDEAVTEVLERLAHRLVKP